ncbi:MAG: hypothetical protein Q7V53_03280 [Caldisericota bacterium]|jgi:hypothetical protein|nr:hypothetical protein [Caldisericota bacterium]
MTVQDQTGSVRITFVSKKGETIANINPAATDQVAYDCAVQLMTLLTETASGIVRNRRATYVE